MLQRGVVGPVVGQGHLHVCQVLLQDGLDVSQGAGALTSAERSLLVWTAGKWTTATVAALVLCGASLVFAVGECLHGAIQAPMTADLAPPRLLGRYLALSSLSWQVGWIVGPAAGGFALQHAPLALWPLAAAANVACAFWALGLERRIPENVRKTPLGAGSGG